MQLVIQLVREILHLSGNSQGKVSTSQGISETSGCGNHVKVPLVNFVALYRIRL